MRYCAVLAPIVCVLAGCSAPAPHGPDTESRGSVPSVQKADTDSDGDGIPDIIENNGIDHVSSDGTSHHLDLKGLRASPTHKDILVWVDWMGQTNVPKRHGHKPRGDALQIVKDSFSNAAVSNPDGGKGINLIVVISPEPVPHQTVVGTVGSNNESDVWAAFDKIKDSHFPKALAPFFHYCLFAHDIGLHPHDTSGISRGIPASHFIVSLGSWGNSVGTEDEQAGTFMHELGHNLGLHHGGADESNYKPNYLSVMNYFFQTDGLLVPPEAMRFNYSHTQFRDLDERDLDETKPSLAI